jgi:Chaperone of endosialidase
MRKLFLLVTALIGFAAALGSAPAMADTAPAIITPGPCLASTPSPIVAVGTLEGTQSINSQTGTSYTVASSDYCTLLTFNNAAAVAVALPRAGTAGFAAGFFFTVWNYGAGAVTITPTAGTIGNGAPSLAVPQNTGCRVVSDGTNYQVADCTALIAESGTGCATTGCTYTGTVNFPDGSGISSSGATFAKYTANTGTALPTQAPGTLGIAGEASKPTLSANGEGDLYISSTNAGITLIGKGSTNDFTLFDSAGNITCSVPTASGTFKCPSFESAGGSAPTLSGVGVFVISGQTPTFNANAQGAISVPNTNQGLIIAGEGSINDVVIGNKSFTTALSIPTGTTNVVVGGTLTASGTGTTGVNTAACFSSSFTLVSDSANCITSAARLKHDIANLSLTDAKRIVDGLRPVTFRWNEDAKPKNDSNYWHQQIGFVADDVLKLDPRIASTEQDGSPHGYHEEAILAAVVANQQSLEDDFRRSQYGIYITLVCIVVFLIVRNRGT